MLLVTSIITAILTAIFIKLSFAVIGLRRKNKVGLGSGGHDDLERAKRRTLVTNSYSRYHFNRWTFDPCSGH